METDVICWQCGDSYAFKKLQESHLWNICSRNASSSKFWNRDCLKTALLKVLRQTTDEPNFYTFGKIGLNEFMWRRACLDIVEYFYIAKKADMSEVFGQNQYRSRLRKVFLHAKDLSS